MRVSLNTLAAHYIPIDAPPPPAEVMASTLQTAAELGLRGVDLEDRLFAATDSGYLRSVRAQAEGLGLELLALGVKVDFSIIPTRETMEAELGRARGWLDVAAELGVPLLRWPGNGARGAADTAEGAEVWGLIVEKFTRLVAYGASRGVKVGLHNHNHGAVPSTGRDVLRLLEAVPSLRLILDVGQFLGSPGAGAVAQKLPPSPATSELYE